jgi:hypothetical protein
MKKLTAVLIAFVILSLPVAPQRTEPQKLQNAPADFRGDGCTLFPDGNYCSCCLEHDRDYYRGGSEKERRASDRRLYRCVRGKKGWQNELIAPLMFLGVRVLGVRFLPTPFRWGFGQSKHKKDAVTKAMTR